MALGPVAVERGRTWQAAATGEARCIVGARSALFLPFPDLGLMVIDEEHDPGFKQEDRVHYQGRDMAIVRASIGRASIVLASATPSIESHVNARTGRYRHLVLPGRFTGTELPEITPIDMRKTPPEKGKWLAPPLIEAVAETLEKKQQVLLFLNRRGYAPLTLCRTCGHRIDCPQCTAWLVEHRFRNRLNCHHCGFSLPLPSKCPKCGEADSLVACGPGVERIAEEVAERFPEARVALLSSDLIPVAHRDARDHQPHRGRRDRHHHRNADRGEGPPLPRPGDGGGRSTVTSVSPRAPIQAPGNGLSNCSTRSRAGPAASSRKGAASSRPTCPSIP